LTGVITDKKTNKPAGKVKGHNGYVTVNFMHEGITYRLKAHRVAWALAYGADPYPLVIDHINGDKQDNRLHNLRKVTCSENTIAYRETQRDDDWYWNRLTPDEKLDVIRKKIEATG
jgi:hypothetical protein